MNKFFAGWLMSNFFVLLAAVALSNNHILNGCLILLMAFPLGWCVMGEWSR